MRGIRSGTWRQRGFTLIELMIVVVIIGIIAAVAVPAMLRVVSRSKKRLRAPKRIVAVAQNALQVMRVSRVDAKGRKSVRKVPSAVVSSRVSVTLKIDYVLEKGKVVPTYQARFGGRYVLRNPLRRAFDAIVLFPFPRGAGTFSDLDFLVSPKPSKASSRPATSQPVMRPPRYDVQISPAGVRWKRHFRAGEQVRVKIRYQVRGRDQYRYRIAPGKKQRFTFSMRVSGVDPEIPSHSLQPSRQQRLLQGQNFVNHYTWDFKNFLSTNDIKVKFPPQFSKYYRFSLLGKLGGIALLFFALFFWFFGERSQPEKLKSTGHTRMNFGLLLLGFAAFFPLFIFLEDHVSLTWAFAISLVTATVLTTFHVATFMGLKWSLLRSLPLQLFFTIGFTFAVLYPTYRPLAFTIGAIILVAFIIVFHARYQKEKEAEEAERKAQEEEDNRKRKEQQERERRRQEAQRRALQLSLEEGIQQLSSGESSEGKRGVTSSAGLVLHTQTEESPSQEELDALDSIARETLVKPLFPREEFVQHCLFCGVNVDPNFQHCYACGKLLKRSHQCTSCKEEYWYPSVETFSYCRKCGHSLHPPPSPLPSPGS